LSDARCQGGPVSSPSRVDALEALQQRLLHLQRLSAALAAAATREEVVAATLDHGLDVFDASHALVAMLDDEDPGQFRTVASRGYPRRVVEEWPTFAADGPFPMSEALARQEAVVVGNPAELSRRYPLLAGTERSATLVCLPLGDVGGIALGYAEPAQFGPDEIEFMLAVARQCGEAAKRAVLLDRETAIRGRYEAILDAALDCVVTADHTGRILEVNAAAERTFGWRAEQVLGRAIGEVIVPPRLRERHERALAHRVATGEGHMLGRRVELSALRADGQEFPVELTITRADVPGPPIFTAYVRDITERKRHVGTLAFLAEAGAVLAGSLDYRRTLREVARLAVPRLADCCIVDVVEERGMHQLGLAHVDPGREAQIADLERRYPADPADPRSAVGKVIRSGTTTLVEDVTDRFFDTMTRDEAHRRGVHELGMRSLIIAPLIARGRTLGAITLIQDVSDRRYARQDLAAAQGLADRAAVAIDNARLYARQSEIARTLQAGLLPDRLPALPDVEIAAAYQAAGEGTDVGGDFYDVWETGGGGFAIAIGDVSGKGPQAAAVTALARHTIRVASLHEPTPSRVLGVLNEELRRYVPEPGFCTALYAHLRPAEAGFAVTLGCGGHPLPLVRRADGRVEELGRPGTLLGVREQVTIQDVECLLRPGEVLLAFTDGLVEHRRDGELFGEVRLAELLAERGGDPELGRVVAAIEGAVLAFGSGPSQDDVAVLAVRPRPAPAA
jgi:PAS domain S-box-containing protein